MKRKLIQYHPTLKNVSNLPIIIQQMELYSGYNLNEQSEIVNEKTYYISCRKYVTSYISIFALGRSISRVIE